VADLHVAEVSRTEQHVAQADQHASSTEGRRSGSLALLLGRLGSAESSRVLLDVQSSLGNGAATRLVGAAHFVQRACSCGGTCSSCRVDSDTQGSEPFGVQRDPAPPATTPGDDKDAGDLTGTPFETLDPMLQAKLKDKTVYNWGGAATLAEALGKIDNGTLAVLARVAAMISATAPFLWASVKSFGGAWITDNFGIKIEWTSGATVGSSLDANPSFCRDNPVTALLYHGTTDAHRQIAGTAGAPSLHVITGGSTEVHIDAHQPVEGKETTWPFTGQCDYDLSAWWSHAGDVVSGGGATGARGTAVGRFASARDHVNGARRDLYYEKDADEPPLGTATDHLNTIMMVVQKYAAMGAMIGNEWEGDKLMLADTATMAELQAAENLIQRVQDAQADRRPTTEGVGP
jgi:hypothetical protein